jgi:hypothetical protein
MRESAGGWFCIVPCSFPEEELVWALGMYPVRRRHAKHPTQ